MKLKELAKKPALIEVVIDDEATIKEYNEAVIFYTWDRVPMDVFSKLASSDHTNAGALIEVVRNLILDEKGHQIIAKDEVLPPNLLTRAVAKIIEKLGN